MAKALWLAVSAVLISPVLILVGNWTVGQLWLPAWPGRSLPTLGFFLGLFLGPAFAAHAAVKAVRKDWRASGASGIAAVGAFAGLLVLGTAVQIGMRLRVSGYGRLGMELAPVIGAIRTFEAAHGRPPSGLEELRTLALPAAISRVQYFSEGHSLGRELYGNRWILWSNAAWGMGFDSFVYFPNQSYPSHMFGGSPERIGDWVYVHE
jgi:hypothetical protein